VFLNDCKEEINLFAIDNASVLLRCLAKADAEAMRAIINMMENFFIIGLDIC
jgi:hypothetical protein